MNNVWKATRYVIVLLVFACRGEAAPAVTVSDASVRPMAPGQTSAAVYLLIDNLTNKELVINHIHTPVAEAVEVHRVIYENGTMKMRAIKHLKIPRESKLVFEPGGYHLMLMGVAERLEKDDDFKITLEFEGGLSIPVEVRVH